MRVLPVLAGLGLLAACTSEPEPARPPIPVEPDPKPVVDHPTPPVVIVSPKPPTEPEPEVKQPKRKSPFNDQWDDAFKNWTKVYLPLYDYTLLKAQCYQESLLDPRATSYVGAKGLCQFMDYTWNDVKGPLKFSSTASAYDPELSIQAAAYYDAKLRSQWRSKRPDRDRMNLTFASYNAGLGNIIKAQKACGNKSLYNEIIACLPSITGKHATETKTYVKRIRKWEQQMLLEN